MEQLEARFILSFRTNGAGQFGVCYFDITTLQFYIGEFTDNPMLTKYRTLVTRTHPVEVLYDPQA
jgi:DNA mismatch repair ATPase MutS